AAGGSSARALARLGLADADLAASDVAVVSAQSTLNGTVVDGAAGRPTEGAEIRQRPAAPERGSLSPRVGPRSPARFATRAPVASEASFRPRLRQLIQGEERWTAPPRDEWGDPS